MAKRIYQPCGKIVSNGTSRMADVKTYLPDSITTYEYEKYYNISTLQHYAVLGVLVHEGKNCDLRNSHDACSDIRVSGGSIDLINDLDNNFSQISFANLTNNDSIIFICFHDDDFRTEANSVLAHYRNSLHLYPNIPTYPKKSIACSTKDTNMKAKIDDESKFGDEPKIGDGGVLTFKGSCK